jgi:hypothetical protein
MRPVHDPPRYTQRWCDHELIAFHRIALARGGAPFPLEPENIDVSR